MKVYTGSLLFPVVAHNLLNVAIIIEFLRRAKTKVLDTQVIAAQTAALLRSSQ